MGKLTQLRWRSIACALVLLAVGLAGSTSLQAAEVEGGMLAWPKADMARALSIYLPRRLAEENVPGLSIAIVQDGHIVFEQGYGVADIVGLEKVTANTLFEAASLGKPVVAVGALSLMQEGVLRLDVPIGGALAEPWLGDQADHAVITPRQVLTHTSGLSNMIQCCSNESWSEPGSEFSYSGVGYMYLGHAMSIVSEMPFDRFMHQTVLNPLGMASSGYGLAELLVPNVARGFVPIYYPVLVFLVPLVFLFGLFTLGSALFVRLYLARLKLEVRDLIPALCASLLVSLGLIALFLGWWGLLFVTAYVVLYLFFLFVCVGVLLLLFAFLGLMGPADGTLAQGRERSRSVMVVMAVLLALSGSLFFTGRNVPVPAMAGDSVNPASSFRSSAHDLGRFVESMLDDRLLQARYREMIAADPVPIKGGIGWGLGFGVRDGRTGRTLWQWGSNPGFESLMVIDPKRRAGIVLLTNSSKASSLVQEIASHVMGEEPGWLLP